eukprot:gene5285-biopygen7043
MPEFIPGISKQHYSSSRLLKKKSGKKTLADTNKTMGNVYKSLEQATGFHSSLSSYSLSPPSHYLLMLLYYYYYYSFPLNHFINNYYFSYYYNNYY